VSGRKGSVRHYCDNLMIVLTLNSGSTSVKLGVYDTAARDGPPARLANEHHSGADIEPGRLLSEFLGKLRSPPDVVAHRVVHGGTRFPGPARIDDAVVTDIQKLAELAPLHNPTALRWIEAARRACGDGVAQVAVFDTSFFSRLPRRAAEYALSPTLVELGVRRYGFHGLAHEAMWRRWCELFPSLPSGGRLITIQLGGGCSITALDNGQAVDNSMGFSPLEGLVMATRSGDVDPSILPYLQERLAVTGEQVIELLNRKSGLAGLSGKSANPRELLTDPARQSQFAVELYC
jgi:acetate kinase